MGDPASQEPRSVVVSGPATGFRTEVEVGGHRLVVDEPLAVGGADQGPTPYEMLLAGLGACTAMTLRLYADRKKWPLERARISLRHRKVHAQDCVDCETKPAKMDVVDRIITLDGSLTEEQRAKLLEIAERCPVQQTLGSKIQVNTKLA
ncbi:MAG: OsmC family peroxiredoxin [Myxococcaceae bacterium]|nr:MAG: OsmC family peroxiredoxin [Myxococcaceae bacterium]